MEGISFGDHLCSIYQNKVQQFSQLVPFILEGLQQNQKCIYIQDSNSQEEIIHQFNQFGIDLGPYLTSKQMEIVQKDLVYLQNGIFDKNIVESSIKGIVERALADGYTGIRGTAEMDWAGSISNTKNLLDYESELKNIFSNLAVTSICQYNELSFSKDILKDIVLTHPFVIIYGKLYTNKYFNSEANALSSDSYETVINTIIEE